MSLKQRWIELRNTEKGLHGLEVANRLGVAEAELLACADGDPLEATRLEMPFPELIAELPKLGFVKAVTRNDHAVIEVEGTYDNIEFFGSMGQSVSTIDLRIFTSRWGFVYAVREETKRGLSKSLQFFDKSGKAVHKLFLREKSDHAFFDDLIRRHRSTNQPSFEPPDPAPVEKADSEIDVAALRESWNALKDTHEFHGLLRRLGLGRVQALRLAGDELARAVPTSSLETLLNRAAEAELVFMIFVGNPGMLQIHTGAVRKVATMGTWINVLDPAFDLHVQQAAIASAWIVKKPTGEGHVTSLELYDAKGDQILLAVGKRKNEELESPLWRSTVEGLHP